MGHSNRYPSKRVKLIFAHAMFIATTLTVGGCAADGGSHEGKRTPREALRSTYEALVQGDRRAFLQSCEGSDEELEAAEAIFEATQAAFQFRAALKETYGPDAWTQFQKMRLDGSRLSFILPPRKLSWVEEVEISVADDHARYTTPWGGIDEWLVRAEGRWFWDLGRNVKSPSAFQDIFGRFADAFRRTKADVGKPGLDLRSLKERWKEHLKK